MREGRVGNGLVQKGVGLVEQNFHRILYSGLSCKTQNGGLKDCSGNIVGTDLKSFIMGL